MAAKTKTAPVEKSGRSLKHQPNRFLGLFLAPFAGLLTAWLIHVWTLGVNLHWGRLSWVVQASHAAPFVAVSVITAATVGLSVLSWKFAAHRDRAKQGSLAGSVGTLGILFAINVGTGPHYWWSGLFILAGWAVAVIWSLVRLDVARNDKSSGDDHEDGFLERAGLKGWKARKVRPIHDERGEQIATEVEFQHAEGDTVDQLQDAVPRFESASAAPAGMSRATETDRADRSKLTVLHVDPLADVIKLPDPTAPGGSVADPAGLRTGIYSNGHPVLSYIAGTRNVTPSSYLFMGMTRTGKTTTENALLVDVQTRRDAVILYLNKAKGLQDVRPIIAGVEACVLADEAEQAGLYKEAFRQVKAIMAYRQGTLARFGIDAWSAECFASPPWRTDEDGRRVQMEPMPFLIVHVGEADAILDRSGAEAVFLASKGLSLGVCTGWSLQRADHLSMPTGLRYNLGTAWCFGVGDNDSAEFALTTHVLKAGAHPEKWRQSKPGYFYFQGLGVDEEMFPVHARSAGIGANGEKITAAILTRSLEWAPRMAKLDSGSVAATNGWWEKTVAETNRLRDELLGTATATPQVAGEAPTATRTATATAGSAATSAPHVTAPAVDDEEREVREDMEDEARNTSHVEGTELYPQFDDGAATMADATVPLQHDGQEFSWEDDRPAPRDRGAAVAALRQALAELAADPKLLDPDGITTVITASMIADRYPFRSRPFFVTALIQMAKGDLDVGNHLVLSAAPDLGKSAGKYRLQRVPDGNRP